MSTGTIDKMKAWAKEAAGALTLIVALGAATSVAAKPASECLAGFTGVPDAAKNGGTVKCNDCDPTCDTDGTNTPNKMCTFRINPCVNQPDASGVCPAGDIKKVRVKKVKGKCPLVQVTPLTPSGTSSACGQFAVTVKTKKNGTKPGKCKIRLMAAATGSPKRADTDQLTLECDPQPAATCPTTTIPPAKAPVNLGSASNFAVLAGSTVTNTGGSQITGDLGVSPGTAVTGFPPGTVNGTIHAGDPVAAQAILDLTTAFNDAAGRSTGPVSVAGNLGGQTLPPGLYKSTSSLAISSGDLTLDAQGDANAVFIFQMASTLTTTSGRQVILSGGAKASNVFWQVGSSATLGTTSVFKGNILADQSITLDTGATLDGRALTRIGAVTLDTDTVTKPAP
jgi:hypothetical protein